MKCWISSSLEVIYTKISLVNIVEYFEGIIKIIYGKFVKIWVNFENIGKMGEIAGWILRIVTIHKIFNV